MNLEESDLEQHARALLLQSSERLTGAVRSRLTQARSDALGAYSIVPSSFLMRRWAPAGAMAGVVLALFIVLAPHGTSTPVRVASSSAQFEDMDLLTDSDAVPLNDDQDVDYDFYEWAANEAAGGAAAVEGS
jgi:hypothetical protein